MEQRAKQKGKWRRTLCILCSLAVVLSAFPAVQLKAEENAGQEALDGDGQESQTVSGGDAEGIGQAVSGGDAEGAGQTVSGGDAEGAGQAGDMEEPGQKDGTEKTEQKDDAEETGQSDGTEEAGQKDSAEEPGRKDDSEEAGQRGNAGENAATVSGNDAAAAEGAETSGAQAAETATTQGTEIAGAEAGIMAVSALLSYTDAEGNVFTYELDGEGNATITAIRVSGQPLVVPEVIDGAAVAAVADGTACVVTNPGTVIPSLTINCGTVGVKAFSGLTIGTLTIGEKVEEFSVYSTSSTSNSWMQFASSRIDRVVYEAAEIPIAIPGETNLSTTNLGPFYQAQVGEVVFGGKVELIPEFLFKDALMELDGLTVNAARVGAYAFFGEGISIGVLTLGEDVKFLEQRSDHMALDYDWCQFGKSSIGTLRMYATDLDLGHSREATASFRMYGPFCQASIGSLEIGDGVTRIPEGFLYEAYLTQEELSIRAAAIGAYAFAGSGISIGTLTLEESVEVFEESFFSTRFDHYYYQFRNAGIGTYRFLVPELEMGHLMENGLTNDVYGPFYGATVGDLEIGENVALIPEYFLDHASMELGDFAITTPEIGGYAFGGGGISFDTLTIGAGVKSFPETYYSTDINHYWNQFQKCRIGHLAYLAREAATTHEQTEMGSIIEIYPPFQAAEIGSLTLAEDIQCIPDYLLYLSVLSVDELTLNIPVIGGFAFAGANINIGKLTIGAGVGQFSLAPESSSAYFRWEQFAMAAIGELHYETEAAEMAGFAGDDKYYFGPFYHSRIGRLCLGDAVREIPNYCFADSYLTQEELEIHASVVGPGAFSGPGIQIGVLTLGEEVERFPYLATYSLRYFRQFSNAKIGTVRLLSPHIATSASCYKGPFEGCTISGLEIGETAEVIPDFMFYNAKMGLEELALENVAVGYQAFYGSTNQIGTLNVGADVAYSGTVADTMNCFEKAKIGTLEYNGTGMNARWSSSSSAYGMFAKAAITQLNIGEDVECIPVAWFRDATISQEKLTVPCGWGAYAFYSANIKIGTLNLTGDFARLSPVGSYDYGFSKNTIGTVVYDIPSALFDVNGSYAGGPFYNAKINVFILGENVDYLDDAVLKKCSFTECRVYAVEASDSFLRQTLTASYLPASTDLHIHRNSGFAEYFTTGAVNTSWMCEDFYEVSYGGKVYDEEAGEYRIEVIKYCPVCGYTEGGTEALDDSYEVYLSIPVGIPLAFSGDTKSYEGSGEVYAYGRLGNAYEGVRLSVDTAAGYYGTAKTGETEIDISAYLAVGFRSGETAVFTPVQVSGNQEALSGEDVDAQGNVNSQGNPYSLYTDSLEVSVMGIAFVQNGAGDYDIPIPLRIEIFKKDGE